MGWLKNRLKNLAIVSGFLDSLDNLNQRREFVESSLREVEAGSILLDAGCGFTAISRFCRPFDLSKSRFRTIYRRKPGWLFRRV